MVHLGWQKMQYLYVGWALPTTIDKVEMLKLRKSCKLSRI